MNRNSRSKSPQPSGSLLKTEKANITKLRNKLGEIFQRCSNREEQVEKIKKEQIELQRINEENCEISKELEKLRGMVKDALLRREKLRKNEGSKKETIGVRV